MDKKFKVSHSKIKTARRCLKAYYYKYIMKYRKRVKSRPLLIGSLVHSCLESYFRNGYYLPEITAWKKSEFDKMFVEEQALNKDIIPLVKSLVRGYIKTWQDSGLEMLWVEKEFEIEIAPGIWLIGKIDGLAQCEKGLTWLVEHKTCKKMPGEEVRIFDTQAVLYSEMLPLMGEPNPDGVIWDYVRTKPPAKPELLKSGGLSTRKNIDTLPEVFEREIKRHDLDRIRYEDILDELEQKRNNFYRQIRLPFNKTLGQNVMQDLVTDSQQLIAMEVQYHTADNDLFTRNLTRDCSWCDYKTLCHAEIKGDDTDYILKHDYTVGKIDEKKDRSQED